MQIMKYLLGIGLLILGGLIGYFIGAHTFDSDVQLDEAPKTEFITQTVHDTIVKTEQVNIALPIEDEDSIEVMNDSLFSLNDSLDILNPEDTLEDITISREVLEKSKWLDVQVLKEFEDKDSLIKEMLGITENLPKSMLVEFWNSPLNYSGYKFSRSKLVLYGMPSQLEYKLYRKKETYFLSTQNVYYQLKESDDFLTYSEVSKDKVFND